MRAAIYSRVSTTDKGQTVENQVIALRQLCQAQGWSIVLEESDYISGTKRRRPGLDRLLTAAAARKYDVLVVWSIDRLTREGAYRTFQLVHELDEQGVAFYSHQEPIINTSGPLKDIVLAMYATFANMERARIVERVNSGLTRTMLSQANKIMRNIYGECAKAWITPTEPRYHISRDGKEPLASGNSWKDVFLKAGIKGPRLGPPEIESFISERVIKLAQEGHSAVQIAARVRYKTKSNKIKYPSKEMVRKILKDYRGRVSTNL